MQVSRSADYKVAVGVVEGKIYVIGGSDKDSQVEVFDSETQTWDFEEKVKFESDFCVSMKQKVYTVGRDGRVSTGLMWFNTKLKVWTRVVDRDGKDGKLELYSSAAQKMEEYERNIAPFWPLANTDRTKNDLICKLIALDRVGENIRGRIEWSGIAA
ncbi:unnamed protein product, partial [Brassica oleracea]